MKYTAISILSYPAIALLYLFSALLSPAFGLFLLFFTRLLHGFSSLLWIPVEGYIRQNSPKEMAPSTFGPHITFYRFAYVIAPVFVIPVVLFFGLTAVDVHWFLLFIIPSSVLAALIISKIGGRGEPLAQALKMLLKRTAFL